MSFGIALMFGLLLCNSAKKNICKFNFEVQLYALDNTIQIV